MSKVFPGGTASAGMTSSMPVPGIQSFPPLDVTLHSLAGSFRIGKLNT